VRVAAGEGRGRDLSGLGGVIFAAFRKRGRARPSGTAAGYRAARRGGNIAQRGQMLEPVEPALRAVGDLAGDAEPDKAFEQPGRVVRRHAERLAERGGRDQRGRGQDVDGLGRRLRDDGSRRPAGDRLRDHLAAASSPKDVQDTRAQIELETTWSNNEAAQLAAVNAAYAAQRDAMVQRDNEKLAQDLETFAPSANSNP